MPGPRFSVVVPTRERAGTLAACLRTCLQQDFDDYEIIVADNAGTAATREVVESLASDRIRYLRSDQVLAMSANWEAAVGAARGEYIHVVGDDDGLMPYALSELDRLIREHDEPSAVRWDRGIWTWPDIAVEGEGNVLHLPLSSGFEWRETPAIMRRVIDLELNYDQLPMVYNAVVRRDVIDALRTRVGRVFPTIYPDIFSGFALGWVAERYLSVDVPMGIAGLGGQSNGVATLMQDGGPPVASEFVDLNASFGFVPHPRVPLLRFDPSPTMDSFEHARDLLFADDDRFEYDRWRTTQAYLAAIPYGSGTERDRAVAAIKEALADRPELQRAVDAEADRHPPGKRLSIRPAQFGWSGELLALDTSGYGLKDIFDLVQFADGILRSDGGSLRYGTPSYRWWNEQVAAKAEALVDAQGEISRLGRKLARSQAKTEALQAKLSTTRSQVRQLRARRKSLAEQLALAQASLPQRMRRRAGRAKRSFRAGRSANRKVTQ